MTETLTLRPGVAEDIVAVAGIERASFSDPWSESSFRELLRARSAIFLVASEVMSNAVAGYVVCIVVADQAEVLNVAVTPAERGRGLGGRLLDAGLAAVRDRGAREVFLEVRESNSAALGLYGSRGFSKVSRRSRYYRHPVEDALVLWHAIEG